MTNELILEAGKRYNTCGGWVTPPIERTSSKRSPYGIFKNETEVMAWTDKGEELLTGDNSWDLVSEYVDPTADTYRRDLEAKLFVAMVNNSSEYGSRYGFIAVCAIKAADTLIKAMEGKE